MITDAEAAQRRGLFAFGGLLLIFFWQLVIGANIVVLIIAQIGAILGLCQFVIYGFDLLTCIPILFLAFYYGLAVVLKSVRVEAIQSNLTNPVAAYSICLIVIACATCSAFVARLLTPKKGMILEPKDPGTLNTLSLVMGGLGLLGAVLAIGGPKDASSSAVGTGPVHQIGALLLPLLYGSIAVQASSTLGRTGRGRVLTPTLVAILSIAVVISLVGNSREVIADSAIALAITVVMRGRVRAIYIVFSLIVVAVFSGLLSPVILHTRGQRATHGDAISFGRSVLGETLHAAASPDYLRELHDEQKNLAAHKAGIATGSGNYLGNGSNVENRLAWVGLVDNIYTAAVNSEKLGFSTLDEVWTRIEPRALFPDKPNARFAYSDSLSYKFGLESLGNSGAYNFGLPMEGFVSFGLAGVIFYVLVGVSTTLILTTRIAPLTQFSAVGVTLFLTIQHPMIEQTLDGYILMILKSVPLTSLLCSLCTIASERLNSRRRTTGLVSQPAAPWRRKPPANRSTPYGSRRAGDRGPALK